MTRAITSEFRKFFSTRLWWGMAIAMVLSGAAFAALFGFLFTSGLMSEEGMPVGDATQQANSVYTAGLSVGYLLMLTIGILQIGSEYRHKTISGTFLATPNRLRVMLAKMVALLVIGALYAVLSTLASVAVGAIILTAKGHDPFPSSDVFRTMALSLLVLGLWALIGLGVGILIPNQIAAILVGVGVAWIVEPILAFGLSFVSWAKDGVVPYLPSSATNSVVAGVTQPGVPQIEWWVGALVLAGYAVVLAGLGTWRATRQDVS